MTEVRKSRRGRKPLGTEKRLINASVRFNDAEVEMFKQIYGQPPGGEFIRNLLLSAAIPLPVPIPEINKEAYAELARAHANLNQIAHHLNAGERPAIQEIADALSHFRLRLLGMP